MRKVAVFVMVVGLFLFFLGLFTYNYGETRRLAAEQEASKPFIYRRGDPVREYQAARAQMATGDNIFKWGIRIFLIGAVIFITDLIARRRKPKDVEPWKSAL